MSWLHHHEQVARDSGNHHNLNTNHNHQNHNLTNTNPHLLHQHHRNTPNNTNNNSSSQVMPVPAPPPPPPPSAPINAIPRPPPQRIHEPAYQFSLQPVLDFDTDTENNPTPSSAQPPPAPPPASAPPIASHHPDGSTLSRATGAAASPGSSLRGRGRARRGGITKHTGAGAGGGGSTRPPGALSHTKLCRDRLNGMFDQLRNTLPAAPVGVEVKHKAQVLDYAITVLKAMVRRTSELEIELAVSSNRATMDWVTKLVRAAGASFTPVATEVMRVFTKRRHWRLAELWLASKHQPQHELLQNAALQQSHAHAQSLVPSSLPISPHTRPPPGMQIPGAPPNANGGTTNANAGAGGGANAPADVPSAGVRLDFGAAVVNDTVGSTGNATGIGDVEPLALFAEMSRAYSFAPGDGVQGRVWASMRPEWLAGLRSSSDFARADLAARFGLKTCFAVPVTVTGKIEAVMCFYDTRHRPYDSQCVDLAMRLAWALGNATGGKRAGTLEPESNRNK